jgi:hypothetical protein
MFILNSLIIGQAVQMMQEEDLTNLLPSSGRKAGQKLFFMTKIVLHERFGPSGNS